LYLFQKKNKQKKEKSSVRGCSGIGTRKTKKIIFFQGLKLDECKIKLKRKRKIKRKEKNIKKHQKNQ
jgi:hypothetical protein